MVANDRPAPSAPLSPPTTATDGHPLDLARPAVAAPGASEHAALRSPQTAEFAIGELRLALVAAPGSVTLTVALGADLDAYALAPEALAMWAHTSAQLLELEPAETSTECAEYRAPFLVDVEGRPAIAFECSVTERRVEFGLLVTGESDRIGATGIDVQTIRAMVEAAQGAVALVQRASASDAGGS